MLVCYHPRDSYIPVGEQGVNINAAAKGVTLFKVRRHGSIIAVRRSSCGLGCGQQIGSPRDVMVSCELF